MLAVIVLASCTRASVDADEVGVFVAKPYFFGDGGVIQEPLMQGSDWRAMSTDFFKLKSTPIKITESFDDIMSDDNTPVDLTANIVIQI